MLVFTLVVSAAFVWYETIWFFDFISFVGFGDDAVLGFNGGTLSTAYFHILILDINSLSRWTSRAALDISRCSKFLELDKLLT